MKERKKGETTTKRATRTQRRCEKNNENEKEADWKKRVTQKGKGPALAKISQIHKTKNQKAKTQQKERQRQYTKEFTCRTK